MSARKTISNSFSVSTLEDGVVYDLRLTSGIVVQHDNGTRTPSSITISAYERRGEGDAELYTGDILLYNASGTVITAYENYNTVNLTMNQAESVFPIKVKLYSHAESELLTETSIPLAKDGMTVSALDLDNEYDSVNTDSTGKISAAKTISTIVRLYNGRTEVDISAATISVSGSPASTIATFSQSAEPNSGKGRVLSWAFIASQTMTDYEIDISYTYNSVTYKATFTIVASKGQPIYQIQPTMTSVPFAYSSGSYTPASRNVGLTIVKLDGVGSKTMSTFSNAGTVDGGAVFVRYSKSAMPTSKTDGTAWTQGISSTVSVANTDTNLYIAIFNSADVLLDRETIPVIKDGVKGEQGKIGRFYYYAQKWKDSTTVSYEVTDTEAPYFDYNNNYWVFNPTANGTYTMHDMGTPAESTTQNPTDWELMVTDFKFIISQAIFSDFAKLGSAVFNKDFMISQWGEKNGIQSADYQTANPYFFRTNTYNAFNGTMQVVGGDYNVNSRLKVSSFLAQTKAEGETNPRLYTITAKGSTTGGSLYVSVYKDGTNARFGYSSITTSRTEISYTVSVEANQYLSIEVYQTGSSSNVGTLTSITVQDGGFTTQGFIPNIAIDFFKGYIYAMQGFFKNITVEGVLNNLITKIDFKNHVNENLLIPLDVENTDYTQDGIYFDNVGSNKYCLDALNSGDMVYLSAPSDKVMNIFLPFFLAPDQYFRTSTTYNGNKHLITENEFRQLIGKKITFYSDSNGLASGSNVHIVLPTIKSDQAFNSQIIDAMINNANLIAPVLHSSGDVEFLGRIVDVNNSITVELKVGRREYNANTYEVLYWVFQEGTHVNTGWN